MRRNWKGRPRARDQSGFTLVEMLSVVAIIAILVAVSIPLVGGALDRARHATDAANERAAKGAMSIYWMTGKTAGVEPDTANRDGDYIYYVYDAATGKIEVPTVGTASKSVLPYGKCTAAEHKHDDNQCVYLRYSLKDDSIDLAWAKPGISGQNIGAEIQNWNNNLCGNHPMG